MTARLDAALRELADALRDEVAPAPAAPERLLSIADACATLGLGRTLLYAELSAGRLSSVKVGRRRLIPAYAITEYVTNGAAASA